MSATVVTSGRNPSCNVIGTWGVAQHPTVVIMGRPGSRRYMGRLWPEHACSRARVQHACCFQVAGLQWHFWRLSPQQVLGGRRYQLQGRWGLGMRAAVCTPDMHAVDGLFCTCKHLA